MAEIRTALLVGATGLIGSYLLKRLIASPAYSRVIVWVRRPLAVSAPKLTVEMVHFDHLDERRIDAEDVYCCLGTTIKQAGSQEAFRRVDFGYPVALARRAASDGARRLFVVSALGANARSSVFYSRVKGEMEDAVRASGVSQVYFFRPSLLDGPREEVRLGERIGSLVGSLLGPLLGTYRPIQADTVAEAMLVVATQDLEAGIYESSRLRELTRKL
ncbi:MAG: NAD(P)H-binding protein [Burkholderiales bacterium]